MAAPRPFRGLKHDSYWLRRLAYLGARYGSTAFMKHGSVAFGLLFSMVLPSYRSIVRQNLRRIYGVRAFWQEERDITNTIVNYATCFAEALGIERTDADSIQFNVVGQEAIEALVSKSTGFIVATAHVGAWDCAALHLQRSTNRSVIVVMEREADEAARGFQDAVRARVGVEIAHVGDDAFEGLRLLKHLRNGGIIAVQLDRVPKSGRTLDVSLFGDRFVTPLGPFQLSGLTGVPVIPVFCARIDFYKYEVRVATPITVGRRASASDVAKAAQLAADSLEQFLRDYPTQWFHFERKADLPRNQS